MAYHPPLPFSPPQKPFGKIPQEPPPLELSDQGIWLRRAIQAADNQLHQIRGLTTEMKILKDQRR